MDKSIIENSNNGVNGSSGHLIAAVAPGQRDCGRQANPDRHQATVGIQGKRWKIATWNVRTMYQAGKLDNVHREMERLNIKILGISEVRWTGSGEMQYEKSKFIYSGGDRHERGVGLMLSGEAAGSLKGYWAISDRVILVKLHGKPMDINIIQAYAPTSEAEDEEVEQFYESLDKGFRQCKSYEINLVMGDLNAKIGQGRVGRVVGPFGLGERNERGERFVEWCLERGQIVLNTWFRHHRRHLWTWRAPGDGVRNQIDYITINERYRNAIIQTKTFPGADVNSDHVPVVATVKLKLKQLRKPKNKPKKNVELLGRDPVLTERYAVVVQNRYAVLQDEVEHDGAEEQWNNLAEAIQKGLKEVIPDSRRRKKKPWMTEEILEMMDERRHLKGRDEVQYRIKNTEIQRECSRRKEQWLNEQCEEVEELCRTNHHSRHDKIKELTQKRKWNKGCAIKDKDGTVIMDAEGVRSRWSEYIGELFNDDERVEMDGEDDLAAEEDLEILESEIRWAMNDMKRGKAAGSDGVMIEMLQAAGEMTVKCITEIANKVYFSGRITEQMCKSVFIAIPKVSGTLDCDKHRTISIMSQITKILLKVILKRIRGRIRNEVSEEQCGFMEGKGTSNAIFMLRVMAERIIEKQRNMYVCFIDYEKAFDRVRHEDLMEILKSIGVKGSELRMIKNLYWKQKACVKIDGQETEWQNIKRGVRQGCVLSPDLFSLYGEVIMRKTTECEGISIGGRNINNIRYADDTVLIADTRQKLQEMLNIVKEESEIKGLTINVRKTKWMVISKNQQLPRMELRCGDRTVERMENFNYLGSAITVDARCDAEIKRRIGIAKTAFCNMRSLLTNRKLSIKTRKRLIKSHVWSTMLYGVESWTISRTMVNRLEAMEMWLWRRMMKIPWTARRSNTEVLEMVGEERKLMRVVRLRQMNFFGHVMRREGMENLIVTGMVEGTRGRGRPRLKYVDGLVELARGNMTKGQFIRATRKREDWKSMVAHVLEDMAQR